MVAATAAVHSPEIKTNKNTKLIDANERARSRGIKRAPPIYYNRRPVRRWRPESSELTI